MPFNKGYSGNPEGRPKGTPNKVNEEIRQRIVSFLDENFDSIQNVLKQLEPRERIKFYIDLLAFGLPKLKAIDIKTDLSDNTIIVKPPNFSDEERNERIKVLKEKLNEIES